MAENNNLDNNFEEEEETINEFSIFLEELKEADPELSAMLDDMLDNFHILLNKEVRKKENQKKAIKKYFSSERGKIKNREANKRYYYKNKTTTNKVGRPKKNIEEN